jgi:hypothetical protein
MDRGQAPAFVCEALELIAKAFGYDNWNILSAKIEATEPAASTCDYCNVNQKTAHAFSQRGHGRQGNARPLSGPENLVNRPS